MKSPEVGELWISELDSKTFIILKVYDFVSSHDEEVSFRAALVLDTNGEQRVSISWVLDHCRRIS